jgi:hypothetical protein
MSGSIMVRTALIWFFMAFAGLNGNGQSAGEIIKLAIDKTGGQTAWSAISGFRITAQFDQGGIEFPLEVVQLKDGRQYTRIDFQGTEIMQGVFDSQVLWSTDFQTQDPKKADRETTLNVALDANDFPDDLIGYEKKGYQVELEGKVVTEGKEAFKIKLIKEPVTFDGKQTDDVVFYYFDTSTFLPIAKEFEMKHGPIQGSIMVIQLGDYREVQGLWFPFSMAQGVKDAPAQPLTVEKVELNPKIDPVRFLYPQK